MRQALDAFGKDLPYMWTRLGQLHKPPFGDVSPLSRRSHLALSPDQRQDEAHSSGSILPFAMAVLRF
jgi:hypothetical protein